MALKGLLATVVIAALGLTAYAGSKGVNDEAAAPTRSSLAPEGVEAGIDDDSSSDIEEEPERTRPVGRTANATTTTTTQCADVGTFQGCPTHGGPTPGSEEDCRSADPIGPCQPSVDVWNSSTHPAPEYGEVVRAEPGQEITALATGFPAGSELAFCFGEPNAGCLLHTLKEADADGSATLTIVLSDDAPPGEYVVTVCRCLSANDEIRAMSQNLWLLDASS